MYELRGGIFIDRQEPFTLNAEQCEHTVFMSSVTMDAQVHVDTHVV